MNLEEKRRAIRPLLDEQKPADALAAYYALYHADNRTRLFIHPPDTAPALGYVALAQTGMDLLRPLVTLRLPATDLDAAAELVYSALLPGTAVLLSSPHAYEPVIRAFFDIEKEEMLQIFVLDPDRFQPVINVLTLAAPSGNGLPRFVVMKPHEQGAGGMVAAAGLNWQTSRFAEISVKTQPGYRRRGFGSSVVSALVTHLLANGRLPLYVTGAKNEASQRLARRMGFIDSGGRELMIAAVLRPRP